MNEEEFGTYAEWEVGERGVGTGAQFVCLLAVLALAAVLIDRGTGGGLRGR